MYIIWLYVRTLYYSTVCTLYVPPHPHLSNRLIIFQPPQSISLLAYLYANVGSHTPSHTPTLVLAPLSVIDNWQSELTRYE